jgi:predicted amidohydrolase
MAQITVAAVQTRPRFGRLEANLESALALVPPGCDLAVLPELCTTGYQFRSRDEALALSETVPDGPACRRLREFAASRAVHLVVGVAERAAGADRAPPALYNSAVLVRPDGSWAVYRKVHLFWDEKEVFDPGDLGFAVHDACGARIGLMVCFDWIFPEAARSLALAGAHVICHPSNLVLPYCPEAMITRCIENRVFAVTANRVGSENRTGQPLRFIGSSQVVTPTGQRAARCRRTGVGAAVATIDTDACDKRVTPRNDLWNDRRPEAYRL